MAKFVDDIVLPNATVTAIRHRDQLCTADRRETWFLSLMLPATMKCTEWSGLALNDPARCEHRAPCEKLLAFESTDSGRRFLGCAKKDGTKCNSMEWIDSEWPIPLKQALARIWTMYEKEVTERLRQNVVNVEEVCKVLEYKRKMENDPMFFTDDFAKMVADKEDAIAQLRNVQIALSDLKEYLEKKKLVVKADTNIHQVLRAKAEK
ncbi:uncharacterized protein [Aegilops tauschii subsp. strangulata]|uniref:uncharacterized protein n=1 Tax=Aegilops tauschii subsp. strangulata TaxID=200361 RepID=UPI00098AD279|nr:uncharacterized protein LOC109745733 [Aegilops tauschii subsp. strangulata]